MNIKSLLKSSLPRELRVKSPSFTSNQIKASEKSSSILRLSSSLTSKPMLSSLLPSSSTTSLLASSSTTSLSPPPIASSTSLQSSVDDVTETAKKTKDVSDEMIPHVQQDSNPYLKDVIIPVTLTMTGTVLYLLGL